VTTVPEITRMIARIQESCDGHGKPGGRADAARRLEEVHALLEEISDLLSRLRRELPGGGRQR
jgi:hypothetical protein